MILRFEGRYSLYGMCRVFGVSYSGYYKWRKRQPLPDPDAALIQLIQHRYEASNNSAGYRQITLQIRKHHRMVVNHKAVYRIMRKLGIQSVARRRRPYTHYGDAIHRYENLLNRDFRADRPNQKWVTDISVPQQAV